MGSMIMRQIEGREELPKLLWELCLRGTVVEVGVDKGDNARAYLPSLFQGLISKLVLVDPWDKQFYYKKCEQYEMDELFAQVSAEFEYSNVKIIRNTSLSASNLFKSGEVDCVYIDGRHDYLSASEDINAWFDKIKVGGIISGHDYDMSGVKKAVHEIIECKHNLPIFTSKRTADTSWYARKTC